MTEPHVHAYDTRTGEQRLVPRAWIGHPVLGAHLSLLPPAVGGKRTTKPPAAGETPKED